MKIHDLPLHSRPREKLTHKGVDALTDAELVAILLRTGYQGKSALEIAQRLLNQHSLAQLLALPLSDLQQLKGLGVSRAAILIAAQELIHRTQTQDQLLCINHPRDVVQATTWLQAKKQEHLLALYLDARNQIIKQLTITIGTLTSNLIHPREVFAPALELRASQIILVHNHPSGQSYPSEEDIVATEKMVEAGEILDIRLVDHVIVAKEGWTSLKQEKLL